MCCTQVVQGLFCCLKLLLADFGIERTSWVLQRYLLLSAMQGKYSFLEVNALELALLYAK